MAKTKATPFVLDGEDDEANIMDELLRMSCRLRADARKNIAEADRLDTYRASILEWFRKRLRRKRRNP